MLEKYERTHYVYENKGSIDTLPDGKSDIYVDMTRLLQKKAAYDRKTAFVRGRGQTRSVRVGYMPVP